MIQPTTAYHTITGLLVFLRLISKKQCAYHTYHDLPHPTTSKKNHDGKPSPCFF